MRRRSSRLMPCCAIPLPSLSLCCSKKFPLCDGSHNKFNTDCGDNTGPLVIKK